MTNIVLTGGGTAGHCTPNIALLPHLKKHFKNIYYIGSENGIEKEIVEKNNLPFYSIPCAKLNRYFTLKNLQIPFKVFKGVFKARKILEKLKPDVVFSKGGYVALPVVIAAKMKNIPVISHESDYTIGLANKIISRYSKTVLTTFPESAKTIKNGKQIGSPIRSVIFNVDKQKAYNYFGFTGNKPILLITGGSQGAEKINRIVIDTIDELLHTFDVIHLVGKNNLKTIYKQGYYQTEYLQNIELAYAISSVCISRAGSNTILELFSLKIPCVLIPLPKTSSRGDQILNAEYFYKKGFCSVIYQELLTKESLVTSVLSVYKNKAVLQKNMCNSPIKDASEEILKVITNCKS